MGLISNSLSVIDHNTIHSIGPEIVRTMRRASEYLDENASDDFSHPWNCYCYFWFGTMNSTFIAKLKRTLYRMASIINLHPIYIREIMPEFSKRRTATALKPLSGWRNNTENILTGAIDEGAFITRSENEMFNIYLDQQWNAQPQYSACNARHFRQKSTRISHQACTANHNSQFQSLVHEITHLLIHTEDYRYGYERSLNLALGSSNHAWRNADNWGYFIEEFRYPYEAFR